MFQIKKSTIFEIIYYIIIVLLYCIIILYYYSIFYVSESLLAFLIWLSRCQATCCPSLIVSDETWQTLVTRFILLIDYVGVEYIRVCLLVLYTSVASYFNAFKTQKWRLYTASHDSIHSQPMRLSLKFPKQLRLKHFYNSFVVQGLANTPNFITTNNNKSKPIG